MAQRWTIDIANGAFIFESTTKWSLRGLANLNENGETESFETLIALEGTLVGVAPDPADTSTTKHVDLITQFKRLAPFRLQLKLDGTTRFDFRPETSVGSPKIREIAEIPDGASHGTHVKYALAIWVKEGGSRNDILEFNIDSSAIFYNDRLQQQTWKADARGRTLEAAKSFVIAFKPAGVDPLLETHHQSLRTNSYGATWIYDKTKGKGILSVSESVSIKPPGHPVIIDHRTGKNKPPALFRGRFQPSEVTIRFDIEATDEALAETIPPQPHFAESATIVRDATRETRAEPAIFDARRGVYRASFTEFWILTSPNPPKPSHKDGHDLPFPEVNVPPITGGVTFR